MSDKKKKWLKFSMVFPVFFLDLLLGPGLLVIFRLLGFPIYPAARADQNFLGTFLQHLMLFLYPAVLMIVLATVLKKDFFREMGLTVKGMLPWVWTLLLVGVLLFFAQTIGERSHAPELAFYNLAYYVVFVGFSEEFIYRGVCSWLLKEFPWQIRYLLPSFLFALAHLLAFSNFNLISMALLLRFLVSECAYLMGAGCCLQLLRDRTGTLWIPILLHALLDFAPMLHI